jgi:hypothetical protein
VPKSALSLRARAIATIAKGERMLVREYASSNECARAISRAVRILDRAEKESTYPDDVERIAYLSGELSKLVTEMARRGMAISEPRVIEVDSWPENPLPLANPLFPEPAP